jgi:hypothetical protein
MKKLLWVWFIVSSAVYAGDGAGNGRVVICRVSHSQRRTFTMLDLFEHPEYVPLLDRNVSIWENISAVLTRLNRLDSARAESYRRRARQFFRSVRWSPGPLENLPDNGLVTLPPECEKDQIALQRSPIDPEDSRYTLNRTLWADQDNDNATRSAVILHELVYGETMAVGQQNSILARKFTALISSTELETMDLWSYEALTSEVFRPHLSVAFIDDKFDVNAEVNQPLNLDLRQLLKQGAEAALHWSLLGNVPTWVKLEDKEGRLSGTPTSESAGDTSLTLVVRDGDGGAIATLVLHVR